MSEIWPDQARVTITLHSLVLKSLISVDSSVDPPLYRMLNVTRLFCARKLEERGEVPLASRSHARSILELYRRADKDLENLSVTLWRQKYGHTSQDFCGALDWAFSSAGDNLIGVELTSSAWFAMLEFGRIELFRQRVHQALDVLPNISPHPVHLELQLLTSLCLIASHCIGGLDNQTAVLNRLQTLVDNGIPSKQALVALHAMASYAFGQGDYPLMKVFTAQAVEACRDASEPAASLMAERLHALCLHAIGQHGRAIALARHALSNPIVHRHVHFLGQVPRAVSLRVLLARISWLQGDADDAVSIAAEAEQLAEGQHPFATCQALAFAAIPISIWRGELETASLYIDRLEETSQRYSLEYWQSWVSNLRHAVTLRNGENAGNWIPPSNAKLADLVATFSESMVAPNCMSRVNSGIVGWCAPEVIRANAVSSSNKSLITPLDCESALLRALDLARSQDALAWELRVAISLVRLHKDGGRRNRAEKLLAEVLGRFKQGFSTADLRAANALISLV